MKNPVQDVQRALEAAGFKATVAWGDEQVEDPSVELEGTPYSVQVSDYTASEGGIYTVGWWKTPEEEVYCFSPLLKTPKDVVKFVREKAAA